MKCYQDLILWLELSCHSSKSVIKVIFFLALNLNCQFLGVVSGKVLCMLSLSPVVYCIINLLGTGDFLFFLVCLFGGHLGGLCSMGYICLEQGNKACYVIL